MQGPNRAFQLGDRGDSRRVGAVRVEHDRHAERPEERLTYGRKELLAGGHVCPANEDGGVVQILGPTCENGAVDEIADRMFVHTAVAHDLVGTGVIRDHAIENTRVR